MLVLCPEPSGPCPFGLGASCLIAQAPPSSSVSLLCLRICSLGPSQLSANGNSSGSRKESPAPCLSADNWGGLRWEGSNWPQQDEGRFVGESCTLAWLFPLSLPVPPTLLLISLVSISLTIHLHIPINLHLKVCFWGNRSKKTPYHCVFKLSIQMPWGYRELPGASWDLKKKISRKNAVLFNIHHVHHNFSR